MAEPGYLRFVATDLTGSAQPDPSLGAIRGYPITLDEHRVTQRLLAHPVDGIDGAKALRDRLFTLPTHSRLHREDLVNLTKWLENS